MHQIKKNISLILTIIIIIGIWASTGIFSNACTPKVKAALLYSEGNASMQYDETFSLLQHTFMANFEVEKINVDKPFLNLNKYDMVYLDSSVASLPALKEKLQNFVLKGNHIFVPNDFSNYFDLDFFGATEIVKINSVPTNLTYNEDSSNVSGIREIIKDFITVYEEYKDYDALSKLDYGYGFIPKTSVSLADFNGVSLYGINTYGKGSVFYTNPLLPNTFQISGFSLKKTNDIQTHFANSTATANQLLLSEFAAYVSKEKYGYSVKKVLGTYGNPAMAWQLHYEEITALKNSSAVIFGEMCKEYNTIPSYTLIRNTYKWFSKYESMTYLINDKGSYHMDIRENAYSSGTHVVENNKYLSLVEVENTGSYFIDNPDFMQTSHPYIKDINNDGNADIISGSSDGKFYYFEGEPFAERLIVKERQILVDSNGNDLQVESYSSPSLFDYNNDGIYDIISGDATGNIIVFTGIDALHYNTGNTILSLPNNDRTIPFACDFNNDNIMDLVIGSIDGSLSIYEGTTSGELNHIKTFSVENETFLSPFAYDYNGDNNLDLILGTFDGYVRKLKNNGNYNFSNDGFFDTEEMNLKGNNHVKFGNNCVPRLFDINCDGFDDLVAGQLEYGLAVPIDSPYFKYNYQLQSQIDYIKDNNFYLGVHFYTSEYSSPEREAEELRLHKRAFDAYTIDYDDVGANMHTWRMSEFSPTQTLMSAKNAGLKWMSCFRSTGSTATPDVASEFALISPFFTDFKNKDFMVTNASVLAHTYDHLAYMYAKYDLPISEYYHCDFVYADEQAGRNMIEKVVAYQKEHGYSFVREDQLIKSSAAAYNMILNIKPGTSNVISLSSKCQNNNFPLYEKDYQDCTGVKIEFSDKFDVSKIGIDADVWRYDSENNALYIGLNSNVKVNFNCKKPGKYQLITSDMPHILSVNIPADVKIKNNVASVKFEDDGMMQVSFAGEVKSYKEGWNCEFANGITTLTKFGSQSDLWFEF